MDLKLGQFYLYRQTVYVFTRETKNSLSGRAFYGGRSYSVGIDKEKENITLKDFIPIDPAIAKMIQATQDPPV